MAKKKRPQLSHYLGGIVQLKRTLRNSAGDEFKRGTTMVVTSTHRGKLSLGTHDGKTLAGSCAPYIRQVERSAVELVLEKIA